MGAAIVDWLIGAAISTVGTLVGRGLGSGSDALGVFFIVVGSLASFAFGIWNLVRQGQTGQTVGKSALSIRLVRLDGTTPPGVWLSIGRALLHILDGLPCLIGYLWPLWDAKRQTFADKIVNTVVVAA